MPGQAKRKKTVRLKLNTIRLGTFAHEVASVVWLLGRPSKAVSTYTRGSIVLFSSVLSRPDSCNILFFSFGVQDKLHLQGMLGTAAVLSCFFVMSSIPSNSPEIESIC